MSLIVEKIKRTAADQNRICGYAGIEGGFEAKWYSDQIVWRSEWDRCTDRDSRSGDNGECGEDDRRICEKIVLANEWKAG